jgi:hypothetical protein
MKSLALLAVLVTLFSTYMTLPLLSLSASPYQNITSDVNHDSLSFNSLRTSFINLFRFQGFHSAETFGFSDILNSNPIFIFSSMIMVVILVFSIVKRKPEKLEMFFLGSILIFIFLAKGSYPPFSGLFTFLFDKIFIFQMYRATYVKFMPFIVFSTAILCGMFVLNYKRDFSARFGRYFLTIVVFGVCVNTLPLVAGKSARSFHLSEIPVEYNDARKYLSSIPKDFSVISLPQLKGSSLRWSSDNYYAGQYYQDSFLLGRPVWGVSWFDKTLNRYFSNSANLPEGLKLLRNYGVKFVLLHKDIPEDYDFGGDLKYTVGGRYQSAKMLEVIKQSPELKLVNSNQYFNLYEINDRNFIPQIYTPFTTNAANPNVEFTKVNATEFKIKILGAGSTFPLVFATSYHPDWELYQSAHQEPDSHSAQVPLNFVIRNILNYSPNYDKEINFWRRYSSSTENKKFLNLNISETLSLFNNKDANRVLLNDHYRVNNYANAWSIAPKAICEKNDLCVVNPDGTYNIYLTLFYKPQRYFMLGLVISAISFILSVAYILLMEIKHKRQYEHN